MPATQQKSLFVTEPEPTPWERDDEADRLFAEIVFNRPVDEMFVYEVPYPLRDRIGLGKRVLAPFGRGNERLTGYCVRLLDRVERRGIKKLDEVIDDTSLLSPAMMELARWVADHYCCAFGQALDAVLPGSVKVGTGSRDIEMIAITAAGRDALANQKLLAKQHRVLELLAGSLEPTPAFEFARLAACTLGPIRTLARRKLVVTTWAKVAPVQFHAEPSEPGERLELNPDQRSVIARIARKIAATGFHAMLLFGVTGSGKTEVYLQAIEQVVAAGRQAIVLVPEISLTPQTIRRFRSRFPRVAVLHSHLADVERHTQWRRIAAGDAQVVVGARSAIFAPTRQLGLIVIDEEHEGTFKQDTTPRYHARDVAWRRAELEGVPLLLGSATPSLESWHRAKTGRCELLELPERVLNRPLPDVTLIDLRHELMARGRRGALSHALETAMRRALESGGQVILLLNRRGFSTHIQCHRCGHSEKCRRCDISLVYHRDRSSAICHFCDLEVAPPTKCSKCGDATINFRGLGTERLEQEVRAKFPGFACHRMDTDSMRGRGSHERVLSAFRRGAVKILLGTQMIAKGLDFPGVTLVGVVNADTALNIPDFRAAERTFQLVAQVAGRTGRGDHPGRVLVQTFNPGNAAIRSAAAHDFLAFAATELPSRREHSYPPYASLARIIIRSTHEDAARQYSDELARALEQSTRAEAQAIRILGPAPAPVMRVKNFFRFHLQMQFPEATSLGQILRAAIAATPPTRHVEVAVDVDPLAML